MTVKPKIDNKDIYFEEHRAFVKDIINGTRSRAYIENILPTTKILDAIYKSAETKKEISF